MGITSNANAFIAELDRRFRLLLIEVDEQILEMLHRIGTEAVNVAKTIPPERGFTDQSGNLRSSIGYVIFKNGKAVETFFEQVKGGKEGVDKGRQLANQVGKKYSDEDYALVVVAGMNYAVYVESKGRDVLASGEATAYQSYERESADMVKNVKEAIRILFEQFGIKVK